MPLPAVTATGGIVTDPELKFSQAGKPWIRFRLACKDRVRGQSGEYQDGDPTFVTVKAWGKVAENLIESATVGDTITVVGKLQQEEWQAQDGSKRSDYSIIADIISVSIVWNTAKTPRVLGGNATAQAMQNLQDADVPWKQTNGNATTESMKQRPAETPRGSFPF